MPKTSFSVDNQKLNVTLFFPKQPLKKNPAAIFIHGWRSDEEGYAPRAEALTKLGFICLTFDMRSHGKSEGDVHKLTRQDYLNDCLAAYDVLASQHGVDKDRIGIVGASMGGYLGALVTSKRKVRWLVMRVPANYPDAGFEKLPHSSHPEDPKTHAWRESRFESHETASLRAIHEFDGDVLIIESEKDTIVPHQTVMNYVDAVSDKTKLTHVVMNNTGHSLESDGQRKEFIHILQDWFGRMIS